MRSQLLIASCCFAFDPKTRMRSQLLIASCCFALVLGGGAGCHTLLPYESEADKRSGDAGAKEGGGADDAFSAHDVQDADAVGDARRADLSALRDTGGGMDSALDSGVDGQPRVDAALLPDLPVPVDAPPAPDLQMMSDLAPDQAPPLADGPVYPTSPCGPGATVTPTAISSSELAFCTNGGTLSKVDQCHAAVLCNQLEGWALCPASSYRTLVGASPVASLPMAWIAGCIREGPAAGVPLDSVCDACIEVADVSQSVNWSCDGSTVAASQQTYIGVRTSASCYSIGEQGPHTESLWQGYGAYYMLRSAVCCKMP